MNLPKLQIRYYGDPCLRQKSEVVKDIGPAERMLIHAMVQAMYDYKGIGLAAPQVGINQRIFVVDIGEGPRAFVNLKILKTAGESELEEGCLSIPEVNVMVRRPEKILVSFMDERNQQHEMAFDEMMARVIQHENDHLDGRLIFDHVSDEQRKKIMSKLNKLKRQFKKPTS